MSNHWARKIRGVVGTAVTWGVAFAGLGTILSSAALALSNSTGLTLADIPLIAFQGFVTGAITGSVFASMLAVIERRKTLASLSTKRAAIWGFVGAAGLPMLVMPFATAIPASVWFASAIVSGVIGGAIAFSTVGIAKRAQLASSDDPVQTALNDGSSEPLLK